jgi:predicted DNA-binding transcriptional regulator AlpA
LPTPKTHTPRGKRTQVVAPSLRQDDQRKTERSIQMTNGHDGLLNDVETAEYLGVSPQTLRVQSLHRHPFGWRFFPDNGVFSGTYKSRGVHTQHPTEVHEMANEVEFEERLLTETETAALLGLKPNTLRQLRCTGGRQNSIPPLEYVKLGAAVRYPLSAIRRVIAENLVQP